MIESTVATPAAIAIKCTIGDSYAEVLNIQSLSTYYTVILWMFHYFTCIWIKYHDVIRLNSYQIDILSALTYPSNLLYSTPQPCSKVVLNLSQPPKRN